MNVFELRDKLIADYSSYIRSFIRIRDSRVDNLVTSCLDQGLLWPDPLIQLNPAFQYGGTIDDLVKANLLHPECGQVFRAGKDNGEGKPLHLYQHQADAIGSARAGRNYVLTTGTGSGKSLAYIIPIVDHVLRNGTGRGIQAIVVYPMNALANSQYGELCKFLQLGYPDGRGPVTFAKYTGQEGNEERNKIVANPPDILLKLRDARVDLDQGIREAIDQGRAGLALPRAGRTAPTAAAKARTLLSWSVAHVSSSVQNSFRLSEHQQLWRAPVHTRSSRPRSQQLPPFCSAQKWLQLM
ncbi:MAG: DEAD/DEAH box helicase [Bryobacterales bacterium]|nr:DEAD/DEAH box helicase [Bryobacterales bacterium]